MQSANNNLVCNAAKMTPATINGTQSLQELFSYQLFNQTGPSFPVFNATYNIVATSTPGVIQISAPDGSFITSRAAVDVSVSNGLYDYVVFTDGSSFKDIILVTRLIPSAQQVSKLASFLTANGFYFNIRDVARPDNCQYAGGITPNVVPASPSEAAAPNNRIAVIVGSVVGGVAFIAIAVCAYEA